MSDEGTGTGSSSDGTGSAADGSVGEVPAEEGEPADDPSEESAEDPTDESVDEPAEETADEFAEDSIGESAEDSTEESIGESADGPADVEPMDVETADPEEVERLRRRVEEFEAEIEDRTVHREELEGDLEQYVRRKLRRGHARGWGPYLVLLYGTVMTLGAFYFLAGVWAVLAMLVIWLSTLGLYVVMLLVGWIGAAVGIPGRVLDLVREFRD